MPPRIGARLQLRRRSPLRGQILAASALVPGYQSSYLFLACWPQSPPRHIALTPHSLALATGRPKYRNLTRVRQLRLLCPSLLGSAMSQRWRPSPGGCACSFCATPSAVAGAEVRHHQTRRQPQGHLRAGVRTAFATRACAISGTCRRWPALTFTLGLVPRVVAETVEAYRTNPVRGPEPAIFYRRSPSPAAVPGQPPPCWIDWLSAALSANDFCCEPALEPK